MKKHEKFRGATLPMLVAFLLAVSAAQAQEPRYSSGWSNPDAQRQDLTAPQQPAALNALVKELRKLTRQAERDRAADPNFLADLKNLARRYSWPWQHLVVADNFRDGDFSRNPSWTVSSGSFSVRREGLITTAEGREQRSSNQPRRGNSDDLAREILGGLLGDLQRDRRNERVHSRPERARIHLRQKIPNRFAIKLRMRSRTSQKGRFEFGVGQGKKAVGYYLRYNSESSPTLSLIQKSGRGRAVIDAVTEPLSLEDGRPHTFLVTRDRIGDITVAVDGETKLRVRDRSFRDPFDRFVMTNRGGSYAIRSVAIYGAPEYRKRPRHQ